MNLKRCDNNCTFFDKTTKRYCTCHKIERQIDGEDISLIGKLGCASHSDAGKERERVLDELDKWIEKHKWTRMGIDEKPESFTNKEWDGYVNGKFTFGEGIQKLIKELRQGCE